MYIYACVDRQILVFGQNAKNVACCEQIGKMENCGLGHGKVWPRQGNIIDYKTWLSQLAPSNESFPILPELTSLGQAISVEAIRRDRRDRRHCRNESIKFQKLQHVAIATCNIFRFSACDKTVAATGWGKASGERMRVRCRASSSAGNIGFSHRSIRLQLPADAADKMLIREREINPIDRERDRERQQQSVGN